jgi:16S rRNA (cytosine967-C5)-methyltransferase
VNLQGNEATTPRMNAPSPARVAALDRLARQAGRFPDLEFVDMGGAPTVDGVALDGRDAALARAIEHMVAHRWMSLAAIARACVDRRWENVDARVQAALLAAGAQLFLFGNIADHAVVDDTVEWTKVKGHRGASGFVNAVLRRMIALRGEIIEGPDAAPRAWRDRNDLLPLADGRAMRLTRPVFSSDRVLRVAEQVSVGEDLLLHWINAAGRDMAFDRAVHCLKPAPTIIAGLPDSAAAGAPFAEHLAPHDERGFHVWKGDHASLVALLAAHPEARVQDAASAQPMRLADGLRPLLILDACAGRGTKTRQLATLHPDAEIVATDVDGARLRALALAFADHPRVKVTTPEGLRRVVGKVDLLVLDVPCSNTGVVARRPEAKYRFNRARMDSVTRVQRQIVEEHRLFLATGASVLYSTCSLEPPENLAQAEWAAGRLGCRVARTENREPRGMPGDPDSRYADGGFGALISPA